MDPNAVVLEISSDEEVDWVDSDDHNWIAELLDEVNKDDDDSDEVVVVSEVLPARNPRKKLKLNSSSLTDLDDDCVILDNDPDKPLEIQNDDPNDDGNSDDLIVVGEKGQVACRDYPHSRHLCIKFPFFSTPNQSHCDQCYCYVCDSLAPCVLWGNGSASFHHCHATDKDEFWVLERKNSKNGSKRAQPVPKVADPSLSNRLLVPPASVLVPPVSALVHTHNQVSRPTSIRAFGVPNFMNQIRSPMELARSKYQPGLVSQQLIETNKGHHDYNLVTPFHRPVFKRTGSAGVATTANGGYRNPSSRHDFRVGGMLSGSNKYLGSSEPNMVNTCSPFLPNYSSSTVNSLLEEPNSNSPFDFSPNFQSQVNSEPYLENPILAQPHPISSSSQPQMASSETPVDGLSIPVSDYNHNLSHQENQGQSSTIHPNFIDYNISWPPSDSNPQTATESSLLDNAGPINEPSLAPVSGGQADGQYDNWIFDNQPVEPGSKDIHVSYGLNEFSPDHPAFIGTGTIFNF